MAGMTLFFSENYLRLFPMEWRRKKSETSVKFVTRRTPSPKENPGSFRGIESKQAELGVFLREEETA